MVANFEEREAERAREKSAALLCKLTISLYETHAPSGGSLGECEFKIPNCFINNIQVESFDSRAQSSGFELRASWASP